MMILVGSTVRDPDGQYVRVTAVLSFGVLVLVQVVDYSTWLDDWVRTRLNGVFVREGFENSWNAEFVTPDKRITLYYYGGAAEWWRQSSKLAATLAGWKGYFDGIGVQAGGSQSD